MKPLFKLFMIVSGLCHKILQSIAPIALGKFRMWWNSSAALLISRSLEGILTCCLAFSAKTLATVLRMRLTLAWDRPRQTIRKKQW